MPADNCRLCGGLAHALYNLETRITHVDCPCCGKFTTATIECAPELMIATREASDTGAPLALTNENVYENLARAQRITFAQKRRALLELAQKRSRHVGQFVMLSRDDAPLAKTICQELPDLIDLVTQEGFLEINPMHQAMNTDLPEFRLTAKAWTLLQPYEASQSRRGFIAMHFDASLEDAHQAIRQAITEAGYEPLRVDQQNFADKICDRVIADIRQAQFAVADLTNNRPNVYYEAGFAQALGKPVFWTCRQGTEIHFDVRQYPYIEWATPEDLRRKLADALRARLLGPR